MKGESLAAAALSFVANYNLDMVRMPTIKDYPIKAQSSLDRPADIAKLEEIDGRAGFWSERLQAVRKTVELADKKVAVFDTISDPLSTLGYIVSPELLATTEKNHATFLEKGLETVTASLKKYVSLVIHESKVDGLVVEVASASYEFREQEEFKRFAKPYLKELLNHIRKESEIPIWLQISGRRVYIDPLLDLPHNLLSWSHLAQGPALDKLPKGYKGAIAGGIDEQAVTTMSYQDIRRHIELARNQFVRVLSIGDAFPADISPSRLAALAHFLSRKDRDPEDEKNKKKKDGDLPPSIIDEP